ncbi:MAG: LysM peptidoglycan-binding protein [Solirubrobacterales bacterium]|nr:LysM peptidoglycan-binding protein [Solirubrobacterales bacterium]
MRKTVRALATILGAAAILPTPPAGAAVHVVAPGETLSGIAAVNGLPSIAVADANGLAPDAFVISGTELVIPAGGAAPASPGADEADAPGAGYGVRAGDTLSGIAAANGVSAAALAAANGLAPDAFVVSGTRLKIPAAGTQEPAAAPAPAAAVAQGAGYSVRPGDTLSDIAAAHGVSTDALAAANGLGPDALLISGTRLKIPAGAGASGTAAGVGAGAPEPLGAYKVRAGDTLSALAARSGVPVAQMAYMNGLDPKAGLIEGTILKLPTGSPVQASGPAPQATIVPSAPPLATPGRLTAAQIGQIAAQHGVPSSLATAIAWQESGFNNAMVSSANARGIMQMMPGTWDWVQANLAAQHLDPTSATDNVRAGSLYLAQLLRETNGDPALAAAGYYQGLGSVRSIGMLPETRRYVDNVLALRARFGG